MTSAYARIIGLRQSGKDAENARSLSVRAGRGCRLDDQRQQQTIEYLREENRVLREQLRAWATG
jgi:hypothetical protein